jgi:signal transduction histidine kinase
MRPQNVPAAKADWMGLEAVLDERGRLAREMHDTVIQGCARVTALIEALSSLPHAKGIEVQIQIPRRVSTAQNVMLGA